MDRIKVASSDISSVGYDSSKQVLEIEFLKGSIYQYSNVSFSLYNSLMGADSKGKYFNQFIKKAGYPCIRIK